MKRKYRVLKRAGIYTIQVSSIQIETTGYLWWKKTTTNEVWTRCDETGNPLTYFHGYLSPPINEFDNLQDAMDRVNKLCEPDQIFEPGTQYEGLKKPLLSY